MHGAALSSKAQSRGTWIPCCFLPTRRSCACALKISCDKLAAVLAISLILDTEFCRRHRSIMFAHSWILSERSVPRYPVYEENSHHRRRHCRTERSFLSREG